MYRIIIAVALSIALVACSHTSEQGKNYTITHAGPTEFMSSTIDLVYGYVHREHARDWKVYELASSELCAEQSFCAVIWFDKEAPETEEEINKWDEGEPDPFVEIAVFSIDDGKVSGVIDCDFFDAPDLDRTDSDKASVECEDARFGDRTK